MRTLSNITDRREILSRIANLSARDRALWGKMTVNEMLCHLSDCYRVALREKTVQDASGFFQRTVIKWLALQAPIQWMKGYRTRPELEQGKGGTVPAEFDQDRNFLASTVNRFCDSLAEPCIPHPVFGRMRRGDWWRWGYLHADHHLRQFGR